MLSKDTKKILFITGSLPPIQCGVGFYTRVLLKELKQTDVELSVITTTGAEQAFTNIPQEFVSDWKLRQLPALLRKIRQRQPNIIHIQYPTIPYKRQLGINLLPLMARIFYPKAKLIVTLHEYHGSSLLGKLRSVVTAQPTHRVLVSNQWDKKTLPPLLQKRTVIIPIGGSVKRLSPDPIEFSQILTKFGLDSQKKTLLFFGIAFPTKGLEILIDAIGYLPDYQLLLITTLGASDQYEESLIQKINKQNSINKRIAWTGFLEDPQVSTALQGADYFILPQSSPLSPKSSSAIAAITHGLIVISKRADDPRQSAPFADKENCLLLEVMTAKTLAEAIESLEHNPAMQLCIKNGAKKLADYFSWDNIIAQHQKIYEEL